MFGPLPKIQFVFGAGRWLRPRSLLFFELNMLLFDSLRVSSGCFWWCDVPGLNKIVFGVSRGLASPAENFAVMVSELHWGNEGSGGSLL
jgi:hypothetical protein